MPHVHVNNTITTFSTYSEECSLQVHKPKLLSQNFHLGVFFVFVQFSYQNTFTYNLVDQLSIIVIERKYLTL